MTGKTKVLFVFFLCGIIAGNAQDQDTIRHTDTLFLHRLSEVVITASRNGTPVYKTPEAIRSLAGQSIMANQFRTAPEALLQAPGVFVQKSNHGGGSPFLRGLTGNQTLLLIDGIRLSNATMRYGPNQYFNTIDVFSIGRIEVLRGSGSVQYGSDAIGGTIQAFSPELTYSGKPAFSGTLIGRTATYGMEQSIHSAVGYQNRFSSFRAGFTFRNFGDLVGGDTTGVQSPTGYRELDFDLKGQMQLSPRSEITLAFQRTHQDYVPVFHKIKLENYAVNHFDPQNRNLAYFRLHQRIIRGILKSASFTGSWQQTLEGRISQKNGSSVLRKEFDRVQSLGLVAEVLTASDCWQATHGIEVYHDLVASSRTDTDLTTNESIGKRGLYPNGATMTSLAVFTLHTLNLRPWTLTAGARFNSFIINIEDETLGKTRLTPSALVGNLALMRKLTQSSNLFISVNTGFRAPNIDDLGTLGIVDFRYEVPNFNLKPEQSFQYQAGFKHKSGRLSGEVYLYRNELYNLIVRNRVAGDSIEGYPVYLKENIERGYIMGAETNWDLSISRSLSLSGNLTYAYGQNITRDEPLRRIPPLFGSLALAYHKKSMDISLVWQAAAKQERLAAGDVSDNRIPAGGTPGWNVVNLHAGYTWRFLLVNVSLINLFNEDYRFHGSGVNGTGRSAILTLQLHF